MITPLLFDSSVGRLSKRLTSKCQIEKIQADRAKENIDIVNIFQHYPQSQPSSRSSKDPLNLKGNNFERKANAVSLSLEDHTQQTQKPYTHHAMDLKQKISHFSAIVDQKSPQMASLIRSCMRVNSLDESLRPKDSTPRKNGLVQIQTKGRKPQEKNVQFHSVEVREYSQCVGDNPCCSSGPPVSLDWAYQIKYEPILLEFYETHCKSRRREKDILSLSEEERVFLLIGLGYSFQDLMHAEVKLLKDQMLRQRTLGTLKHFNIERAFENVRQKYLKRAKSEINL